jgi:hypothetical protein
MTCGGCRGTELGVSSKRRKCCPIRELGTVIRESMRVLRFGRQSEAWVSAAGQAPYSVIAPLCFDDYGADLPGLVGMLCGVGYLVDGVGGGDVKL